LGWFGDEKRMRKLVVSTTSTSTTKGRWSDPSGDFRWLLPQGKPSACPPRTGGSESHAQGRNCVHLTGWRGDFTVDPSSSLGLASHGNGVPKVDLESVAVSVPFCNYQVLSAHRPPLPNKLLRFAAP
jgi:hypothetical protein